MNGRYVLLSSVYTGEYRKCRTTYPLFTVRTTTDDCCARDDICACLNANARRTQTHTHTHTHTRTPLYTQKFPILKKLRNKSLKTFYLSWYEIRYSSFHLSKETTVLLKRSSLKLTVNQPSFIESHNLEHRWRLNWWTIFSTLAWIRIAICHSGFSYTNSK